MWDFFLYNVTSYSCGTDEYAWAVMCLLWYLLTVRVGATLAGANHTGLRAHCRVTGDFWWRRPWPHNDLWERPSDERVGWPQVQTVLDITTQQTPSRFSFWWLQYCWTAVFSFITTVWHKAYISSFSHSPTFTCLVTKFPRHLMTCARLIHSLQLYEHPLNIAWEIFTPSNTSSHHFRPSGIYCCRPDCLELAARLFPWSIA